MPKCKEFVKFIMIYTRKLVMKLIIAENLKDIRKIIKFLKKLKKAVFT